MKNLNQWLRTLSVSSILAVFIATASTPPSAPHPREDDRAAVAPLGKESPPWMKQEVGTWGVTIKAFDASTGDEVTSKGTEINKWGPGRNSILTTLRSELMGKSFIGHGVTGQDDTGGIRQSWTDNRSKALRFLTGKYDSEKKQRVLFGESLYGGEVYKERQTMEYIDRRRRRFTIETQGSDGKWLKALELSYIKRR